MLKIDSIINYAISTGVMPGCQVFIAKNGVVVFDKSYGYHFLFISEDSDKYEGSYTVYISMPEN